MVVKGPPFHILAKPEEVADRVIVAGDPARVKQVAGMLEEARLVNENRGLYVYTGAYRGVPVSVAVHGIGGPSASLVFEELRMLGAKVIVRLGTCGGMVKGLKVGDVVVASGAAYMPGGNSVGMYAPDAYLPAAPHPEVTMLLYEEAKRHGLNPVIGPVFSSDAFYAEDPEFAGKWAERGVIAVEMECAAIFALGWMRRVKTGALLVVSDSLVEETGYATAEELRDVVEKAARAALEALVRVEA